MKTLVSAVVVALLAAGPVAGAQVMSLDEPALVVVEEPAAASTNNVFRHVLCLVRKTHC